MKFYRHSYKTELQKNLYQISECFDLFIYIPYFHINKLFNKIFNRFSKRKCFMGDFKHFSDIDCPNNRLKYWIASQSTLTKQKKKIKFLHN